MTTDAQPSAHRSLIVYTYTRSQLKSNLLCWMKAEIEKWRGEAFIQKRIYRISCDFCAIASYICRWKGPMERMFQYGITSDNAPSHDAKQHHVAGPPVECQTE